MSSFSIQRAARHAWDVMWDDNLRRRAAGHDFRGNTFYLTATDIERGVRALAHLSHLGKPWPKVGKDLDAWHYGSGQGVQIRGLNGLSVLDHVRRWLRNAGLQGHNFGRGHISGMRYRPRNHPLSPGEKASLERMNQPPREKRVHAPKPPHGYAALCAKPRSGFSRHRSKVRVWSKFGTNEVTCPSCLKLIGEEGLRALYATRKEIA